MVSVFEATYKQFILNDLLEVGIRNAILVLHHTVNHHTTSVNNTFYVTTTILLSNQTHRSKNRIRYTSEGNVNMGESILFKYCFYYQMYQKSGYVKINA